ncbi:MAG: SRPBCC family protein [Luteolibacter sp.]|uniref:SRPBCC family protein n=1 Tax=Luteolibacter sp. TaxID=1962973 RepID=UPI00326334D3
MNTSDTAIITTRLIDIPRERVFGAFSDPLQLAKWWGPEGFTNTFEKFEFRPGGGWKFVMHGPNGADYPNESEFLEIVEPEKIVFDHLRPMHHYHMVMTFADEGGNTRLTWNMTFQDQAESEKLRDFILKANEQNFDRLEAHLARFN